MNDTDTLYTQGVTLALRGLGKAACREELEEAEGLRADCGDEEEAEVELTIWE